VEPSRGSVFFVGQDIIINGTVANTIYLAERHRESARLNEWECFFLAGQTIYLEENSLQKRCFYGEASIPILFPPKKKNGGVYNQW